MYVDDTTLAGALARGERVPVQDLAAAARPAQGPTRRILVRDGPRVHVIPVEKIEYVQAQDDYVCFRCEGKEYLKEQTLGELETALDPAKFVRIHANQQGQPSFFQGIPVSASASRTPVATDRMPRARSWSARPRAGW